MGLQKDNLPVHVALIMDGNRRWARKHRFSPFRGHFIGEERIEPVVDRAIELGIQYLTFWAFSTENWKRTKREVQFLLKLYRGNLSKTVSHFHQKNVRVRVIGNLSMFPNDIQKETFKWIEKTKNNTKITVNIALSYGGRDELLRAIVKLVGEIRNSKFEIRNLTAETFSQFLDTARQPDPDLMIRTGGVTRLSGFMLWQMEYAEFYFTDTFWPDFTVEEFDKAIAEYQRRQRRYGK